MQLWSLIPRLSVARKRASLPTAQSSVLRQACLRKAIPFRTFSTTLPGSQVDDSHHTSSTRPQEQDYNARSTLTDTGNGSRAPGESDRSRGHHAPWPRTRKDPTTAAEGRPRNFTGKQRSTLVYRVKLSATQLRAARAWRTSAQLSRMRGSYQLRASRRHTRAERSLKVPLKRKRVTSTTDASQSARRHARMLRVWTTQLAKAQSGAKKLSHAAWSGRHWVPILDPRSPEWVERVLEKLDAGQTQMDREDLSLADNIDPTFVWVEIALWFLTYDPRSMARFLEATHVQPYIPANYIVDSLLRLTRYWVRSEEPDKVQQMQRLADVFCLLSDRGSEDSLKIFNPFIRYLIQYSTDEQILRMYECINLHRVSIHWHTYLHFATYFAKHDRLQGGVEALLEAKNLGASLDSYGFLSNCSTILRRTSQEADGLRLCMRLVSALVDMGVQLNNVICDIIMLNAVEAGDLKTAFSVYHSLLERGLQPRESTFAVLLKGCKLNFDDAGMLNDTIRDAIGYVSVRKSQVVASEILHCLALHHSKHNPAAALDTLTEAYAQLYDLRPLQQLGLPIKKIDQRHDEFMIPSQNALNIMIGACVERVLVNRSYADGVLPLYERWRQLAESGDPCHADLATSDYTANIFLMAFIRRASGLIHAARVVRDMQNSLRSTAGVEQAQPTVQTWSIFLAGFTRHGKTKLAEQVLTYMRSKGIEPNHVTWNTLMAGYARAQDEDGALDALHRAQQSGMVWDRWTYGGLKALKIRQRLDGELQEERLQRRLDFTEELKEGLEQRLSPAGEWGKEDGVVPSQASPARQDAKVDGASEFVDSPADLAEQTQYSPF